VSTDGEGVWPPRRDQAPSVFRAIRRQPCSTVSCILLRRG